MEWLQRWGRDWRCPLFPFLHHHSTLRSCIALWNTLEELHPRFSCTKNVTDSPVWAICWRAPQAIARHSSWTPLALVHNSLSSSFLVVELFLEWSGSMLISRRLPNKPSRWHYQLSSAQVYAVALCLLSHSQNGESSLGYLDHSMSQGYQTSCASSRVGHVKQIIDAVQGS